MEDVRFPRDDRGPHSRRKSSHDSKEASPFVGVSRDACPGATCTVDLTMAIVIIIPMRVAAMTTYFLARTMAQDPIFKVITSLRKVGKLIRDFLAMTFRHLG